ncbi:MAG: hypothetical protein ABFD52_09805 [Acidobacteriota bacterium]
MPDGQEELLSSWKEIAAYLKRTVRTCQRLEAAMGLPVEALYGEMLEKREKVLISPVMLAGPRPFRTSAKI